MKKDQVFIPATSKETADIIRQELEKIDGVRYAVKQEKFGKFVIAPVKELKEEEKEN